MLTSSANQTMQTEAVLLVQLREERAVTRAITARLRHESMCSMQNILCDLTCQPPGRSNVQKRLQGGSAWTTQAKERVIFLRHQRHQCLCAPKLRVSLLSRRWFLVFLHNFWPGVPTVYDWCREPRAETTSSTACRRGLHVVKQRGARATTFNGAGGVGEREKKQDS